VTKDYRRLKRPAEIAQRLKPDPALKQLARPDLAKLASPPYRTLKAEPEPEPAVEKPKAPEPTLKQAIIQAIVRRLYPPDGDAALKVRIVKLTREVVEKWEATCNSKQWRDACEQHGVNPKQKPDRHTVARALGREV
jgi:hypothetical protein